MTVRRRENYDVSWIGGVNRFTLLVAFAGLLGFILVLLRQATYGVGLTDDAWLYISTARNLLDGGGFATENGLLYQNAPLFPLALFGVGLLGVDPIDTARYLNAVAFGLTICITVLWLRSRIESPLLLAWAGFACALAAPLTYPFVYAWAEPLFILFAVASLFALDRFWDTDHPWSLPIAASLAALACLTHYIGVTLLIASVILLLWQQLREPAGNKTLNLLIYIVIAIIPVALCWLALNTLPSGAAAGMTFPSPFSEKNSLNLATYEALNWLFGPYILSLVSAGTDRIFGVALDGYPTLVSALLKTAILLTLAAVVGGLALLLSKRAGKPPWNEWAVPSVFMAVYALSLSVIFPIIGADPPVRYLTPLYIPALVTATLVLDWLLRYSAQGDHSQTNQPPPKHSDATLGFGRIRSAFFIVIMAGLSLWLIKDVSTAYSDIQAWNSPSSAHTYWSEKWANSQTVRYVKKQLLDQHLLTNRPHTLYFLTDTKTPLAELGKNYDLTNSGLPDEAYFIWFHQGEAPWYAYGLVNLATELPGIEFEAVLSDGVILKFDRKSSGAAEPAPDAAALRQTALKNAQPIINANFDVYLDEAGRRLIYVKDQCSDADIEAVFYLHIDPLDLADLPAQRQQYTFDNLDFWFGINRDKNGSSLRYDGLCLAARRLPDYSIAGFRTGQVADAAERLWEGEFIAWNAMLNDARLVVQADFDVHLDEDSRRLIYVKDQCTEADRAPTFLLHIRPQNTDDLPAPRQQYGFENQGFKFENHWGNDPEFEEGGFCAALRRLPGYPIVSIRTGQSADQGQLWEGEFKLWETALANARLVVEDDFNVYLDKDGNRLIYVKDRCGAANIAPRFRLRIIPTKISNLPSHRQKHGSDNLDFAFKDRWENEAEFSEGGRCVAVVRIPDYAIARIDTGQFVIGEDAVLWRQVIHLVEQQREKGFIP